MFPKIGVPQNRRFVIENPIKMDDLGVPLFSETPIYVYIECFFFIDLYIHSLKNNSKWARHVDQDVRSSEEGHLVKTQEIHGNEKNLVG